MDQSHYTEQQIDDYIMGLLNEEEKALFDQRLASDNDLRLRLQSRNTFIKGIEEYHSLQLKDKLKKIHKNAFGNTPAKTAKRRNLVPLLAAAATVALLVIALFWLNNSTPSAEQLYTSNFKPYTLSLTQRNEADEQLLLLEDLYNKGQYQEAIPLFEARVKQNDSPGQLQLGLGISKLALHQSKEALQHFDDILKSGDLLFKDHALWYSALAALAMDDQQQAKYFLEQLTQRDDADHYEEAVRLLKEM